MTAADIVIEENVGNGVIMVTHHGDSIANIVRSCFASYISAIPLTGGEPFLWMVMYHKVNNQV